MKIYKTVNVPASTYKSIDKTICDVCGKDVDSGLDFYQKSEVDISYECGEIYPEGGNTKVTSFDLCGECFEKKLVPFLKLLGANPTVEDRDY
jgi:hypothetical protein